MSLVTPAQIVRRKKRLKVYLKAHGQDDLARHINLAPVAGPVYRKGIRWLQHHEWPKLPTNGIADTRVLAVLFPPPKLTIGQLALRSAKTQLGVKENPAGSNHGLPYPTGYQAILGLDHQPWCACFVTWCLRQVGWKQTGWNQAYVPSWVGTAHLAQHGLLTIPASAVVAGDIATFDWDDDGVADHIEFVEAPVKNGTFPTIGGNTSPTDASNGGAVTHYGVNGLAPRRVSDVAAFIRIT